MPSKSAAQVASTSPQDRSLERVLALLTEALEIVDVLKLSPEIGAKLQETISALEAGPTD